jgi:hypothetical protein
MSEDEHEVFSLVYVTYRITRTRVGSVPHDWFTSMRFTSMPDADQFRLVLGCSVLCSPLRLHTTVRSGLHTPNTSLRSGLQTPNTSLGSQMRDVT